MKNCDVSVNHHVAETCELEQSSNHRESSNVEAEDGFAHLSYMLPGLPSEIVSFYFVSVLVSSVGRDQWAAVETCNIVPSSFILISDHKLFL